MKTKSYISTKKVVLVIILFLISTFSFGQFCDSITPSTTVDLSASPNQTWVSPPLSRDGNCCGTSSPDNCLEFVITLNPSAIAVSFNIVSGAVPPGALFYQIDCGPITPVGSPICLTGPGPFHLTFCKPGNNTNTFSITSYSEPIIGPDISLNSGCTGIIYANYYNEPSMTWTSIFPGATGAYDSYLDCTSGCDTVIVTAGSNPPTFVDYLVCGTDIGGCNPLPYCDTIRVTFITPVTVNVSPSAQHLCFGDPNTSVTAFASGGTAPYNYLWNSGQVTSSIIVGAGTYIVNVTDASGCLIAIDTAIITQDLLPIAVNANVDQNTCAQSVSFLSLNGMVQTASGGIWTGGGGFFNPSNTTLNADYFPNASEISFGYVDLILTTTGNNGCPAVNDVVRLNFLNFSEAIILNTIHVSCNGLSDGEAHVSTSGVFSPSQYSWDGGPLTLDTFALNLTAGIHQIQLVNSLGCDTLIFFNITQPSILNGSLVDQINNLCNGDLDGEAEVSATGGTIPYFYAWNSIPVQNTATAINLAAGNFACTITDANGCSSIVNVTITEPTALTLSLAGVEPNCYNASNGAISSLVTGGISPYLYNWSSGPVSSNLYDLQSNMYSLIVTDANNCQVSNSLFLNEPSQMTGTISNTSVICPNSSIDIGVTAAGGTGNYQYEWTPNGQMTDTITEIPTGNQVYSCEITDNNGCSIILTTNVILIVLNPTDLIASISSNAICESDPVFLTAQYIGTDTTVSLSWMHCPSCPTNTPLFENPMVYTQYILSATNNCGQTIYDTVEVIVNPLPLIVLAPVMATICPGESVSFINNGNNSAAWDYVWNFGDGSTSSSMSPMHQYSTTGTYLISLTVTDNNGCVSTVANSSQVVVNPQAHAVFASSSVSETTLDPTFTFTNFSTSATNFVWNYGDGQMSNVVSPTHIYDDFGMFMVTLTANNSFNCPDSTFIAIEVKPSFDIYLPNAFTPDNDDFNEIFFAQGYGISENGFTLYIFNRWGDLIFESHEMNQGWDGMMNKDGTKAQDGVYTWVVYFKDISEKKHKKEGHVSLLK